MLVSPPAIRPAVSAARSETPPPRGAFARDQLRVATPYLVILGTVLCAHGLLLLNDGTYWDDWILVGQLRRGNWQSIHRSFSELGSPISAYAFWGLRQSGLLDWYRIIVFAAMLATAFMVYRLARAVPWLDAAEALAIALISAVYPAYQTTITLATAPYTVYYAVFMVAVILALRSELQPRRESKIVLRVLALALFALSFLVPSFLIFYFGCHLLLLMRTAHARGERWWHRLPGNLVRRADYVLLPFGFWIIKQRAYPPRGLYATYNNFQPHLLRAGVNATKFIINGVYTPVNASLSRLLDSPLLWLVVLAGVETARRTYRTSVPRLAEPPKHRGARGMLAFAVLLFLCGTFPYVAVGLAPSISGWGTRHALLVGLPVAIAIVALLRLIPRRWNAAWPVAVATVVLAFALSTVRFYAGWQARWAKDRALIDYLGAADSLRSYSVYWVDDRFPLGGEPIHAAYEWASMFRAAWGGQSRIGLEVQAIREGELNYFFDRESALHSERYNLADFDPAGPQVLLTIRPISNRYSEPQLARRYLFFRIRNRFRPDDQFGIFLRSLARIEARPVPSTGPCAFRPFPGVAFICPP